MTQVISIKELHDDVAENGVVGSVLLDPEIIVNSESLKPRMFYNVELGTLYEIIHKLFNDKGVTKIDDYTIISEIEKNGEHKNVIYEMFLNNGIPRERVMKEVRGLIDKLRKVGTIDRNEYIRRCESIMTMDFRRRGANELRKLANSLEENREDSLNLANMKVQDSVMKLAENYLIDSSVQTIGEIIEDVWAEIQDRTSDGIGVGFPSKFKKINEFYTYEKGELVIIGGRARLWLAI